MLALTMSEQTDPTKPLPRHVLVVDDHPEMAALIARTVSQAGLDIEVIPACSGQDALEKSRDLQIDLLITDLVMPDMSGLELIQELRGRLADHPPCTILITAYDVFGLAESVHRAKVDHLVFKPFPPDLLIHMVRRSLHNLDPRRLASEGQPTGA